MVTQNKQ